MSWLQKISQHIQEDEFLIRDAIQNSGGAFVHKSRNIVGAYCITIFNVNNLIDKIQSGLLDEQQSLKANIKIEEFKNKVKIFEQQLRIIKNKGSL